MQKITLDRIKIHNNISDELRKYFSSLEKYYYFIDRGIAGIYDIAYSYDKLDIDIDREEDESVVKLIISDEKDSLGWIETPLRDAYETRQSFMKENNRRIVNLIKLINYEMEY